ncbi:unnamed protein product [Prorocentrum cordatum]|uniref:Potassium channel domain-containing protein n=1 Tax=Prorocentrum cordatum TaxID=2364126 RepID=A0ABN9TFM1_9DINO|nr:unnamed protein product [Polarella glacialis]
MKDGGDAIDDGGQRSTLMSPLVNAMMGYSMLCILAYAVFCHVEDVDQITAIYIIVQIVTTIGYGDITPKLPQTRIFVMCFVIVTLVVLAYVLNLVVQKVTEREETFLMELVESTGNIAEAQSSLREQRVSKERRRLFTASMLFFCALLFGTLFYAASEPCSCSYGMTTIKGCSSVDYDTCIATDGEQKTLVNAMYFSVITLTTVGFGDFTPQTHLGRWVGIFWMIFGVTATANWIGAMSSFLFERAHGGGCFCRLLCSARGREQGRGGSKTPRLCLLWQCIIAWPNVVGRISWRVFWGDVAANFKLSTNHSSEPATVCTPRAFAHTLS